MELATQVVPADQRSASPASGGAVWPGWYAVGSYAVCVATAAVLWFLMAHQPLRGDELVHARQIEAILSWLRTGAPFTLLHPTIPGYHAIVAAVAAVTGISGIAAFRAIASALNLLAAAAAWSLVWSLTRDPRLASLRMAQAFFLAIAFPFLPLLYTDLFSAALVIASVALTVKERYAAAGVVATLAVAVRQNNVLWLCLTFLVACIQLRGALAPAAPGDFGRPTVVLRMVGSLTSFLLGFLVFAVFVLWNGGQIALADQWAHPSFTIHLGNLWAAALTGFLLFLPLAVARVGDVVRLCRQHGDAVWIGSSVLVAVYLLTFGINHPYNVLPWWLHNKLLLLATSSVGWKLLFFLPVLYQILVFAGTPLQRPEFLLLYPVSALCLATSWLIEPRYFLIPFLLFMLVRRPERPALELALLVWNGLLGVVLFSGVPNGHWLP